MLEKLVTKAVGGDRKALEEIVIQIQDLIYNLAIRMLWHPDDAKDATQETLIQIITRLNSFQGKSSFKTWVYRAATNHLLNYKNKVFKQTLSFQKYKEQLEAGLSDNISFTTNEGERNLLVQEAKIGCSNAMLQCLNKESRMVYILGEILEFNSLEGAKIMGITAATFRQKLSRSRKKLHSFLNNNCGIVNSKNKCRCYKKVDNSIKNGLIDPEHLFFAQAKNAIDLIESIDSIENAVYLYQRNPEYGTPTSLFKEIEVTLEKVNY